MNLPYFSIVIPVYNRVEPLRKSLISVINQTFSDFEVVVIDDGSNVQVKLQIESLISEFSDNRIRLIAYEKNCNGAVARNKGINAAKGKIIAFLDSDDEWKPEKLTMVQQFFVNSPSATFVFHQYLNKEVGLLSSPIPKEGMTEHESVAEYLFCTNKGGGIQSSCISIKSEVAKKVLFEESLRGHQDWDFSIRVGDLFGKLHFIDEVLSIRNISEGNINMVSRTLDFSFSFNFLLSYRQYFSWKAAAAFSTYILESNRLICSENAKISFYGILGYLYYPVANVNSKIKYLKLKRRCDKLHKHCINSNISRITLVGYNSYTHFILSRYGKYYTSIGLVDKSKPKITEYGEVSAAVDKTTRFWKETELLVAMTDKHFESMQNDIMPFTNKAKNMYAF